jgi:hypothetical protein
VWIFAALMMVLQSTNLFMPPPAEPYQFALMALTLYAVLAAAAAFVEKKWGSAIPGMNDASM